MIVSTSHNTIYKRISLRNPENNKQELGYGYLYIIKNDQHQKPYGLVEDVMIAEEHRGNGYGTQLLQYLIESAKEHNCYKLIATSRHNRHKVHSLYKKLGFSDHGKEFRMDLD